MDLTPQQRLRAVRRVLWITLFLNFLVAGAKLGYGHYTKTLSMVADGFHSLLDGSSNIIGLIALGFAAKPPDKGHPYGHHKIEALVAIIISGMLFFACYEIFTNAYNRIHDKIYPDVTIYSFLIMIGTMAINYGVSRYELKKGLQYGSQILTADSAHTASDVWASLSVIIALIGIEFKIPYVDIIAASFIALFVGYSGYKIVVDSLNTLMDRSILEPKRVVQAALSVPGVLSCHNIRTRGHPSSIYMDLNIHVDPKLSLEDAHELTHKVIARIQEENPQVVDVVVHTEPATPGHD
ncbi:MAG: cation diffusion facilitator family transporter [bacterium]|nr:cation diffusion facilitator family transporter [bacterium]